MSPLPDPITAVKSGSIRKRRSETARRAILDAGAAEFAAKGFEGGSMRSIARSLGIEIAHIQHHFGDKTSLWEAVVADVVGSGIQHMQWTLEQNEDAPPEQRLAAFIDTLVRYAATHPHFVAMLSLRRPASTPYAKAYEPETQSSLVYAMALIEEAQANGRFMAGDPGLLFFQMTGAALRIFTVSEPERFIGRTDGHPDTISAKTLEDHIALCISLFIRSGGSTAIAPETRLASIPAEKRPSPVYLIGQVDEIVAKSMAGGLKQLGLTFTQMIALVRIAAEHKLSAAKLACLLDLSPQSVAALVKTLEARGLIRRIPPRGGQRALAMDVTPAGFDALERLRAMACDAERDLLDGLTMREKQQFSDALTKIVARKRPHALCEWSPLLASR